MAAASADFANKLGVDHVTKRITWGQGPFPPKPPSAALEGVARSSRYELLFTEMVKAGSSMLALGHHLDDQVETCLMRLGRSSSLLGAAGMRPLRRWGTVNGVMKECLILQAMGMWQIRPFLGVGKVRYVIN
jgi:tRNA(Ile)-lysidine synthase